VFELQDHVTSSVVGAIAPKLEQAEIERAKRKPTERLDAYDYYLRGKANLYRWTNEGVSEALRLFYKAIELDPEFASAYGAAAWCYFWRMQHGWMTDRAHEVVEATRLAGTAVTLANDDAVALSLGGLALGHAAGEVEAGIAMIDRALMLNPNLAVAWNASGLLVAYHGDHELAIERSARAMRLSPLDPLMFWMHHVTGVAQFFAGRYDEAWTSVQRTIRERPNFLPALRIAAASNALIDRLEEARRFIARVLQLDPELRTSNLRDRAGPLRPEDFAKYAEALRRVGMPE
jgi:tetratricopeptide (TPR) repeat protein